MDGFAGASLAAGIPAAWAWLNDVALPYLERVARALTSSDDLAEELARRAYARLYVERASGDLASADRCCLSLLLRLAVYDEVLELVTEQGSQGLQPEFQEWFGSEKPDSRECPSLAALAVEFRELEHASRERPHLHACPTCSLLRRMEERIPPALRVRLPEMLHAMPSPKVTRKDRDGLFFNLPAAIAVVFLLLSAPALYYALTLTSMPQDDLDRERVLSLLRSGEADQALRVLAQNPPPGLSDLRPLWPELRGQRLASLIRRQPVVDNLRILTPRNLVTSEKPDIQIWVEPPGGEMQVLIFDSDHAQRVYDQVMPCEPTTLRLDVAFQPGVSYTIAVQRTRGGGEARRARFRIIGPEDQSRVDAELERLRALVGPDSEAIFPFFAAHVYRAHGLLEASVQAFQALGRGRPELHRYAFEEAALVLEDLELFRESLSCIAEAHAR